MRALVLSAAAPIESAPLRLEARATPAPGPREILVRVSACGVCRTDLHIVEGELPSARPSTVPGHQVIGRVERARGCAGFVCTREESHRALARRLGTTWVGGVGDAMPAKMHGAILFAPAGELVPVALRNLERGGTLALAGIYMTAVPPLDYERDLFYERSIRSVTANTRVDGEELLAEAERIPIRPATTTFALEDANRALALLKRGGFAGAGVLLTGEGSRV